MLREDELPSFVVVFRQDRPFFILDIYQVGP